MKRKKKTNRNLIVTHLLVGVSTGCPWEMYSTMTVQKNSVFQWSGDFSHPPSAIEKKSLDTPDLVSKRSTETRKSSFNVVKTDIWLWGGVRLRWVLGLENGNIIKIINTEVGTYSVGVATWAHQVDSDLCQAGLPGCHHP